MTEIKKSLSHFNEAYKPFQYPKLIEAASNHYIERFWHEKQIDLREDLIQWESNNGLEIGDINHESNKKLLTHILNLFTASDVAVGNIYADLLQVIKNNEARNWLFTAAAQEGVHQRAYSLIPETLKFGDKSYSLFLDYKEMSDKWDFMTDYDVKTQTGTALTIAKLFLTEGVSLFGSFTMLLNFQRFKKMMGTSKIVEWSLIDESQHRDMNILLFRYWMEEHPRINTEAFRKKIYDMVREIVDLEDKFIDLAFENGPQADLEPSEVKLYMRYLADKCLIMCGLDSNFNVKDNPLKWLDWIVDGNSHTNFFEDRVTDYDHKGLVGEFEYPDEADIDNIIKLHQESQQSMHNYYKLYWNPEASG